MTRDECITYDVFGICQYCIVQEHELCDTFRWLQDDIDTNVLIKLVCKCDCHEK